MSAFTKQAIAAGFSQQQADFMDSMLAKFPHTHDIEDIEDLEQSLADLGADEDDEDEDT